MSRSVWKGPFVHPSLLKKVDVARASERNTGNFPLVYLPSRGNGARAARRTCVSQWTPLLILLL